MDKLQGRTVRNSQPLATAAGILILSLSADALAHHSFAMFDMSKTVAVEGIVKDFQWTNPHIWIDLTVKDAATGKEMQYSIEGGSPNALAPKGWNHRSLQVGDEVVAIVHPLKNGSPGGSLETVSVNGKQIGTGDQRLEGSR